MTPPPPMSDDPAAWGAPPITIADRYAALLREAEAVQVHYVGRLDELRALLDVGLGATVIPPPPEYEEHTPPPAPQTGNAPAIT